MKHSLLTCFLLMTAVTLQAQPSVGQVPYSPYAEWESADSAIARQDAYRAYQQSLWKQDTVYIVLITPDGLYFWLRVDPLMDKYIHTIIPLRTV